MATSTDKALLKILKRLQELDYSKPLRESAVLLRNEAENNIVQQGALYQGQGFVRKGGGFANLSYATTRVPPWKPLAESTRKDRERKGYPRARPILVRSGKLAKGFRIRVTGKSAIVENIVSYAGYHQRGSKKLPRRAILGVTQKSYKAINLIFQNYIKDQLK